MCGRFVSHLPAEVLAEIFGVVTDELKPNYNVAPTQTVPVIRQESDHRILLPMKWGLVPSWAKDPSIGNQLINARSETVATKPSFRHAIKTQRCLVPASGWYDWAHEGKAKLPYFFHLQDGRPLGLAGIWETWQAPDGTRLSSFAILTTQANEQVAQVHDRMPVIVVPEEFELWLSPQLTDPVQLEPLYRPNHLADLEVYRVSDLVNSPRNNSPECLRRV